MSDNKDIIENKDLTNKVFYVDNTTNPPIVYNVKCLGVNKLMKKKIEFGEKYSQNRLDETQKEKMSSLFEELKTKLEKRGKRTGGKKRKTNKRKKNKKRKTINKRRK
jgi:hypothetical protein